MTAGFEKIAQTGLIFIILYLVFRTLLKYWNKNKN